MKKFFLIATLGVAGLVSANSKNDIKTKAEVQTETKTKVQKVSSESSWCQWCVRIDGISYCSEARTCDEARKQAREMAMADQ